MNTFVVSKDGVVYQMDLGAQTGAAANAIKRFNPDQHWVIVDD